MEILEGTYKGKKEIYNWGDISFKMQEEVRGLKEESEDWFTRRIFGPRKYRKLIACLVVPVLIYFGYDAYKKVRYTFNHLRENVSYEEVQEKEIISAFSSKSHPQS